MFGENKNLFLFFKPCLKNRNYCYNLNETVSFSHNYSVMSIGANGGVGWGGGVFAWCISTLRSTPLCRRGKRRYELRGGIESYSFSFRFKGWKVRLTVLSYTAALHSVTNVRSLTTLPVGRSHVIGESPSPVSCLHLPLSSRYVRTLVTYGLLEFYCSLKERFWEAEFSSDNLIIFQQQKKTKVSFTDNVKLGFHCSLYHLKHNIQLKITVKLLNSTQSLFY